MCLHVEMEIRELGENIKKVTVQGKLSVNNNNAEYILRKRRNCWITGLKVLGISTVNRFDVVSDDNLEESLTAFSNGCCSELDFPLGRLGKIEEDVTSKEFTLLDPTFSLYTCSNGSSSECFNTGDIVPKILFLLIWNGMIFEIFLFTFVDEKMKLSVRPFSRRRYVYIGERTP
ncbi:hypothetical protein RIR_jg6076.t1 [Rhizophagus irregularis DAOM 181602=DAOM 197198]|nr:hypothetical protein RIR_jg6076.t1 [Rhizophagus irregularis DAOM 181602=DAOM 197198]